MNGTTQGYLNIAAGAAAVWVGFGRAPKWAKMLVGVAGGLAVVQGLGFVNGV